MRCDFYQGERAGLHSLLCPVRDWFGSKKAVHTAMPSICYVGKPKFKLRLNRNSDDNAGPVALAPAINQEVEMRRDQHYSV